MKHKSIVSKITFYKSMTCIYMLNYIHRWRVGSVFLFLSSHRPSVGLVFGRTYYYSFFNYYLIWSIVLKKRKTHDKKIKICYKI